MPADVRLAASRVAFAIVSATTICGTRAEAEPTARSYLDLPITQSVNRDGVIRYAVWIKVGDRSVEAMIDTGSTGLRVLPTVFPDVPLGIQTDISFGAGIHMAGVATRAPVQIGSVDGVIPIEVVKDIGCVATMPHCDFTKMVGDGYLIGGDGYPSEGYSAILGIRFPYRGTDVGNPLENLGVKQWIVDLPRPYERAEGHLILDPDAKATSGFSMLTQQGYADASGCIQGGPLPDKKCGSVLFDTGAPGIEISFEGVETASKWEDGTTGSLSLTSGDQTLQLDFQGSKMEGMVGGTAITPPKPHDPPGPFILAGVFPFYSYDMLYDAKAHKVGLRKRAPMPPPSDVDAANTTHILSSDP